MEDALESERKGKVRKLAHSMLPLKFALPPAGNNEESFSYSLENKDSTTGEKVAHIPCPVCMMPLKFLPIETDLREPLTNTSTIKHMKAHYLLRHPDEPLWNALPRLDLKPSIKKHSRSVAHVARAKNDVASVANMVGLCMGTAARRHCLPSDVTWSHEWRRVVDFICARIGGACSFVEINTREYFKARTRVIIPACCDLNGLQGQSLNNKFKWLKREALHYLNELLAKMMYAIPPEGWQQLSEYRRRNLIQIFFLDGANHRAFGLLPPDALPVSPHFPLNKKNNRIPGKGQ